MIILFFAISLCFALVATPYVEKIAWNFNLTDKPSERKVHKKAVPRIGGIAIYLSFLIPFFIFFHLKKYNYSLHIIFSNKLISTFFYNSLLIFFLGLFDDIYKISFKIKFIVQIIISIYSYYSGFSIDIITNPFGENIELGIASLPFTIFWFVLVINSINLIDGLDGLAAGISLFASLSMLLIYIYSDQIILTAAFAALAGSLIGFLRYNFNPASIFMGDSGSYFLGYCFAALSVGATIKGQIATALLIPVIILGVPIFDTLWAPVRRFVAGQKMFHPDRGHIHHRLVSLGYTHRRAVLLLYGFTLILGISAFFLVKSQDEETAAVLFFIGVIGIVATRYLRLSSLITMRKISSWAMIITKDIDVKFDHRAFLNQQFDIISSKDIYSLWKNMKNVFDLLNINYAKIFFLNSESEPTNEFVYGENFFLNSENSLLKIELPLFGTKNEYVGKLLIITNITNGYSGNVVKQIGMFHRSISSALVKMNLSQNRLKQCH